MFNTHFINELVNFATMLVLNLLAVDFTFILAFCLVLLFVSHVRYFFIFTLIMVVCSRDVVGMFYLFSEFFPR